MPAARAGTGTSRPVVTSGGIRRECLTKHEYLHRNEETNIDTQYDVKIMRRNTAYQATFRRSYAFVQGLAKGKAA